MEMMDRTDTGKAEISRGVLLWRAQRIHEACWRKRTVHPALALLVTSASVEASTVTPFSNEADFNAATTAQQTTGFTVNCSGACFEFQGTTFTTNGITFFSSGDLNINSAQQEGFSAATLSNIFDDNPAHAGNPDTLTITVPFSVTAFGSNFAESAGSSAITISVGNGSSNLASVTPVTVGFQPQFQGFVSDTPFNTVTFTDAEPDGWLIFNVTTASAAVAVPGPMAGAGFPGLIFAGGALLAWRRKRKQLAA